MKDRVNEGMGPKEKADKLIKKGSPIKVMGLILVILSMFGYTGSLMIVKKLTQLNE